MDEIRHWLLDEMTERALDDEGFRREAATAPDRGVLQDTLRAHGYEDLTSQEMQRINTFHQSVKRYTDEQLVRELQRMLEGHPAEYHRH